MARKVRKKGAAVSAVLALSVVMVLQIVFLVMALGERRSCAAVQAENDMLEVECNNLKVSLVQYQDLERVRTEAARLGMHVPDEANIRVISVQLTGQEDTAYALDASRGD